MQYARGQTFGLRRIVLPPFVGTRFQVLFHSPRRGSFRLSLTVLVHYQSEASIYPYGIVAVASRKVSRAPRYSGIGFESRSFSPTWLSHSMAPLSRGLRLMTGLVTLLLPTLQPLYNPKVKQV